MKIGFKEGCNRFRENHFVLEELGDFFRTHKLKMLSYNALVSFNMKQTQAEKDAVMAQLDEIIRRFQILGRKMIVVVPSIDLTVHATLDDIKADAVAVLREMAKKVEPYGIKLSNEENIKKAAEVIRAHVEACC